MVNFPASYDPQRIGTLFYPDVATLAEDAIKANLLPASEDQRKTHLLIIDMQVDFCHEQGALHVPGAAQDIRRLIEFIYRNAERISSITCSLDSHLPYQIFHPSWWADEQGNHPAPFTVITEQDVQLGKWQPLFEPEWSVSYVRKLRESAKKELTIWPYHVPIGGVGNALDPELWAAVFWHSVARKSQPTWWAKGSVAKTEHYSILRPEIPVSEAPQYEAGNSLLEKLERQEHLIIAGEAASHCVLETIEDLLEEFGDKPETLDGMFILRDCTSPVQHPKIDFAAITQRRFAQFEERGIHLILSTDPLPF
ncbi:cysteine hydrolase family protein [Acidobacteria bacterium AH-259-D05]|nr:cysteine hydrolase family protein [Acidobacteria bacterium AH-259-D05]